MTERNRLDRWWIYVAILVTIALVAGCSGSTASPSPSAPSATAAPSATGDAVAIAQALVDEALKEPPYTPPTEVIDPSSLKGKTVWILDNSMQNPYNTAIANAAADALGRVGIKTKILDGGGQPSTWARQIREAIAAKADAIVDSGEASDILLAPLAELAAAGIPLVEAVNGTDAPLVPGVNAHVAINWAHAGEVMAAYVIAQSHGAASVLWYDDPEFKTSVSVVVSAGVAYFKQYCPACKVTVKNEQVGDLATTVPTDTQSIIRANPDIKWVMPTYDYLGGFVVQGLQQGGLTDVHVVGGNANAQQLDQIRSSTFYVADVGESSVWSGWQAADEIMRAMLGKSVTNEETPSRLFTKDNLAPTNDPIGLYGTDFMTPLLKLWGLQP